MAQADTMAATNQSPLKTVDFKDPDTVEVINRLAKLGANLTVVMKILGSQGGRRRIRNIFDAIHGKEEQHENQPEYRVVHSVDWFLLKAQRIIDACILVQYYRNIRDARVNAGLKIDNPVENANIYIGAYEAYLEDKEKNPFEAEIPIHRMVSLVQYWRNGRFVLRPCKCGGEYLEYQESRARGMCRNCEIELHLCCRSCGKPIRTEPHKAGRTTRGQDCEDCAQLETKNAIG